MNFTIYSQFGSFYPKKINVLSIWKRIIEFIYPFRILKFN